MTDRQDAQVDMYQEVDRLFISNATKVDKDEILKKHSSQFHIDVLAIARFMKAQEFDSKGYAKDKKEAKDALAQEMFDSTEGFCSFAVDNKNNVILEEFDNSVWDNKRLKDAEFVNHANRLIASLGEYIKALAPYHITAEDLVNLTKQTQAYTDLLHIPDEVIKDKAIATDKIKELITKCYNTLEDSIDRDMNYYQEKDVPFYKEYQKRREIHDANTTHKSIIGTVTDADGGAVLPHVKCKVKFKPGHAWKEMDCVSTELGNYQFVGIPDGLCTLTFTREQYETVVKEITVYSNKATKLDMEMKKTIN